MMKKILLTALFASVALVGCKFNNSKDDKAEKVTQFTAVAAKGELLKYTVNEKDKTYSYEIVRSAYGLNGKTGKGTYKIDKNGALTTSDSPNSKMYILPNGLVLGALTETFAGVKVTTPFLGVQNPVNDLNEAEGKFNYIGLFCGHRSSICTDYGTIQIKDNTWTKCDRDNNSDSEKACHNREKGTLEFLGNGRWQFMLDGRSAGTLLMFKSGNQKISLVDLADPTGMGVGLIFASSQQEITNKDNVGEWFYNDTSGNSGIAKVVEDHYTLSGYSGKFSYTNNSPWVGMQTSPIGEKSIFTGSGVFISEVKGSVLFGIKK